jgi:DMSO/TMAO reductase YedYZ molybdopterin-dependent catalytic subunit
MKKKRDLKIPIVLLALAIVIGLLAWANAPRPHADSTLTISRGGVVLRTWTLAEIQALPSVELAKDYQSANHADESGVFRGVTLRTLLDQVDDRLIAGAARIIARASDGYVSTFTPAEVLAPDNIIVAYSKDGTGLGSLADGGTGPFRIIIREDAFGQRATKYLTEIEVDP